MADPREEGRFRGRVVGEAMEHLSQTAKNWFWTNGSWSISLERLLIDYSTWPTWNLSNLAQPYAVVTGKEVELGQST